MRARHYYFLLMVLLGVPAVLPAQRSVAPAASRTAETAFDFLIGRWTLTGAPRVSALAARFHGVPRLSGTWEGARGEKGGVIEDGVRVTDAQNRVYLIRNFSREYDVTSGRWTVRERTNPSKPWAISRPRPDSLILVGEVRRGGKAVMVRGIFSAIRPAFYRYTEARSGDGGASWDEPHIILTAARSPAAAMR